MRGGERSGARDVDDDTLRAGNVRSAAPSLAAPRLKRNVYRFQESQRIVGVLRPSGRLVLLHGSFANSVASHEKTPFGKNAPNCLVY